MGPCASLRLVRPQKCMTSCASCAHRSVRVPAHPNSGREASGQCASGCHARRSITRVLHPTINTLVDRRASPRAGAQRTRYVASTLGCFMTASHSAGSALLALLTSQNSPACVPAQAAAGQRSPAVTSSAASLKPLAKI